MRSSEVTVTQVAKVPNGIKYGPSLWQLDLFRGKSDYGFLPFFDSEYIVYLYPFDNLKKSNTDLEANSLFLTNYRTIKMMDGKIECEMWHKNVVSAIRNDRGKFRWDVISVKSKWGGQTDFTVFSAVCAKFYTNILNLLGAGYSIEQVQPLQTEKPPIPGDTEVYGPFGKGARLKDPFFSCPIPSGQSISAIQLYVAKHIHSIQLYYNSQPSIKYGGTKGNAYRFDLNATEKLTGVNIRRGPAFEGIDGIQFLTNQRQSPWYGDKTGKALKIHLGGRELLGMAGRIADDVIKSMYFVFRTSEPPPTASTDFEEKKRSGS